MEKYMLDTNSWIEYFKNRNGVADHVDALPRKQLCACEITVAELIYGAYNSKNFEKHYREAMWLKNNIEIFPISDALDPSYLRMSEAAQPIPDINTDGE